eukprot:3409705-Rhodomonas_salina.1
MSTHYDPFYLTTGIHRHSQSPSNNHPANREEWDFEGQPDPGLDAEADEGDELWTCGAEGLPIHELSADGEITVTRSKLPTVFEFGEEDEDEGSTRFGQGNG